MGSPLIRRDAKEKTVLFFFFPILEVEEDVEKELLHSESDWAYMEDKKVQRERREKQAPDSVERHQINPEELAPDQTLLYEVISLLSYI